MSYASNSLAVLDAFRREAEARNARARDAHHDTTERAAPVRTGNMVSTLEKFEEGQTAGVTMGGEKASYTVFVNDGHMTSTGGFVSGQHFWEEGEAAGMKEMARPL